MVVVCCCSDLFCDDLFGDRLLALLASLSLADNAVDVTSIVPQGVQGWSWFSCKKTNTCHK